MSITVICKHCGKSFEVFNYRKETARYCSRDCSDKSKNKSNIVLTCQNCQNPFEIQLWQRKYNIKYCSRQCSGNARKQNNKVVLICQYCSKSFEVPSWASKKRQYCSIKCRHKAVGERRKTGKMVACISCGNRFYATQHKLNQHVKYGLFCSAKCRSAYVAPLVNIPDRIIKNCDYCGKKISLQKHRLSTKHNFCSRSCTAKYYLENERWYNGAEITYVVCHYCGQEVARKTHEVKSHKKRGQTKFFCNRKCFTDWKAENWVLENHPSWKGGWTEHGKGWNIIRDIVRKEQNYCCLDCGIIEDELGRQLDVHHLTPARLFANRKEAHKRRNLVGLCHSCHMKWEHSENGTGHEKY